jgi:AGZA family xanthine/uracil permease-like MFS transporter
LNGFVTLALCISGLLPLVLRIIPLEVAGPVIVWFGLVTVGQAFVEVPRSQAIAVALGLVPILAQWASGIADTVARASGSSLADVLPHVGSDLALKGLLALGQGALLTSMIWAAMMALVIERRFVHAAGWMAAAGILSNFGVIHAFALTSAGIEGRISWEAAPDFALSYGAGAMFLLLCGWRVKRGKRSFESIPPQPD